MESVGSFLIESWFPVDILIAQASDDVLDICKNTFVDANLDSIGIQEEMSGVVNGITTYNRGINIPFTPKSQKLIDFIIDSCALLAKKQGVDIQNASIKVCSIWLNRLGKNGMHSRHAHGGMHYSGTLYVNIPDGSSKIRFYNPHADLMNTTAVPVMYDGDPATSSYVDFNPSEGKLLLWNSYLYHEVLEHKLDDYRDTISFNLLVNQV